MKLNQEQRNKILAWLAEGLDGGEINRRAAESNPPFTVSRPQLAWYKRTRTLGMQQQARENDALSTGLALRAERVKKLIHLAGLLEADIFGDSLWVDDVKVAGGNEIRVEKFNAAEVSEYRATLDDIAKEVGDRSQRVKHSQDEDGGPIQVVHFYIPDNGRPHPGRQESGE